MVKSVRLCNLTKEVEFYPWSQTSSGPQEAPSVIWDFQRGTWGSSGRCAVNSFFPGGLSDNSEVKGVILIAPQEAPSVASVRCVWPASFVWHFDLEEAQLTRQGEVSDGPHGHLALTTPAPAKCPQGGGLLFWCHPHPIPKLILMGPTEKALHGKCSENWERAGEDPIIMTWENICRDDRQNDEHCSRIRVEKRRWL